jgi:UDP-2,3-diacylglucosamine pyrophosphatase LpxH
LTCPKCGSDRAKKNGSWPGRKGTRIPKMTCYDCGKSSRMPESPSATVPAPVEQATHEAREAVRDPLNLTAAFKVAPLIAEGFPTVPQFQRAERHFNNVHREFFISDIHFPFHDEAGWAVFLDAIKRVGPDLIFIGGDATDFYAISRFDRDPHRKLQLQAEIDVAVDRLTRLRMACPNTRIAYLMGNHDLRLEKYLNSKAEELAGLRLKDNDIEYLPGGSKVKVGKLWHAHGHEIAGAGANVAKAKLHKFYANLIFGHHHQVQRSFFRTGDDELVGAFANGCMCNTDVEYARHHQWMQAWSVVDYVANGEFNVYDAMLYKKPGVAWTLIDGQRIEIKTAVQVAA